MNYRCLIKWVPIFFSLRAKTKEFNLHVVLFKTFSYLERIRNTSVNDESQIHQISISTPPYLFTHSIDGVLLLLISVHTLQQQNHIRNHECSTKLQMGLVKIITNKIGQILTLNWYQGSLVIYILFYHMEPHVCQFIYQINTLTFFIEKNSLVIEGEKIHKK